MARVSLDNLGRGFLFGTLAEVWRIGSRFVITPVILAAVGLPGYGVWTLIFSLAAYVSIANVGFGVAYTKFTAECVRGGEYERLGGIIGAGIAGVGAVAVVGLLVAWAFGGVILGALNTPQEMIADGRIAMIVVMSVLVLRLTVGCSLEVLNGLQRVDLTHRLTIQASFVEFVVTVPLLLMGYGLIGMAIGYALGQLSCFSIGIRWVKREDPLVRISPLLATRDGLRAVMGIGGRMQGLAFVHVAIAEGVKVLLSVMIDPRATGMYEIADKLVMLARAPTAALVGPMLAAFAELQAAAEKVRERDMLRRGWKAVAVLSCSVASYLAITANPALLAWTGRDVPLAAWAVEMMVLANLCSQQTAVHSSSLRAEGNVRIEFWFAIVSSSVAVVLLVALVGIDPFFAVVASRAIAHTAGATWYMSAFFRHANLTVGDWWRGASIGRVVAVAVVAAIVVSTARTLVGRVPLPLPTRWYAVLDVCVWGIPYGLIVGFGMWRYVLDDEERTQLRGFLDRKLARFRRRPSR